MGKLLGIPNVSGYITSGGTEGNLAAIWWCKNNLLSKSKNQIQEIKQQIKQLKHEAIPDYQKMAKLKKQVTMLERPYLVATKSSHFSVIKVAGIIELNQLFIDDNADGSMNLDSLREKLMALKNKANLNFIVSVNFGTTT